MEKAVSLPILNFHAAGIDIGSRSHFVAVGQSDDEIREFGVSTEGHQQIIDYLKEYGVRTIAMESTGSYWQSLFNVLQEAGFEVLLVPGNQTKHLLKTDVKDARRIQKLHSLGLLSGSFLPDSQTLRIRTITRHRNSLVESCARYTNKIQKSLRLMNIRLDVCLRDVVGKSGRAIIEAVLEGERSPEKLSLLTDRRVKKPRQEILLNLEGQWNDELLFELRDSYELLLIHEQRILNCDKQIELILSEHAIQKEVEQTTVLAKKQTKGKHVCQVDLSKSCYEILGVDIFSIGGVGPGVALTFMSEMGMNIFKFDSAKQFASWLRLSPNNRISGGRVISSRTEKSRNLLTKAFRDAANGLGLSKADGYLTHFFRRIAFRKGRGAAITATARKIAVIFWNMIVKQQEYTPPDTTEVLDSIRKRKIKEINRYLKKYGILNSELSIS